VIRESDRLGPCCITAWSATASRPIKQAGKDLARRIPSINGVVNSFFFEDRGGPVRYIDDVKVVADLFRHSGR
jgi:hypothetical protein